MTDQPFLERGIQVPLVLRNARLPGNRVSTALGRLDVLRERTAARSDVLRAVVEPQTILTTSGHAAAEAARFFINDHVRAAALQFLRAGETGHAGADDSNLRLAHPGNLNTAALEVWHQSVGMRTAGAWLR